MIANIRLNKQNKTIKVVNRRENLHLTHTRGENIRLQHTGGRGPQGEEGPKGDDGVGLPTGGLEGQVLKKESDDNYDFGWFQPVLADKNFTTTFPVTSSVTVTHNLDKYPAVTVVDSAGDEVKGNVYYVDTTQLVVSFAAAFSGRVTCN